MDSCFFPKALVWSEIPTALSWILTQGVDSISYVSTNHIFNIYV